jgi:hypothetical protein
MEVWVRHKHNCVGEPAEHLVREGMGEAEFATFVTLDIARQPRG